MIFAKSFYILQSFDIRLFGFFSVQMFETEQTGYHKHFKNQIAN